ncbi:hypothetical protein MLOOGBEN_12550 [Bacillus sp. EB106-08-02-XG196]|nr:hypothetical protein [Bacillus sp. EB106-08-02-XG196]NWQ41522.1 hypothetical protein [Bacillus sp. EB106-08-02-XG196]
MTGTTKIQLSTLGGQLSGANTELRGFIRTRGIGYGKSTVTAGAAA